MVKRNVANSMCMGISYILTISIVNNSSLNVFSHGENLIDALIAVLTFLGLRSFFLGMIKLYYWTFQPDSDSPSRTQI
jgi:hypothetical protein